MNNFKPMLAATLDVFERAVFPVMVSPKLDGIRCLVMAEGAKSRNMKDIPNKAIRNFLTRPELVGLDGEILVGNITSKDVFNRSSSAVMSHQHEDEAYFQYHVFDEFIHPQLPFDLRFSRAVARVQALPQWLRDNIKVVPHRTVRNQELLQGLEEKLVNQGYEGIMLRDPRGIYKYGRSTLKEGGLLKLKRFADSEATIIGFVEKLHNENEKTRDELGRAKRSKHKAGMKSAGVLGALIVKDVKTGQVFEIGSGFTDADRQFIWSIRDEADTWKQKLVKYRYQPAGQKDLPRFPTFSGFRYINDT